MKKQIVLGSKKKNEIASTFKVSKVTVWSALTYKTNSGIAKMLRAAALQRGGVLINGGDSFEPNLKFDTYFIEVPHQMVQVFSDRVTMRVDISSGTTTIEVDGEIKKTICDTRMTMLKELQAQAQEIVNTLQ